MGSIDMMNETVFTFNGKPFSCWPISHFVLYFVIGVLCAKHWPQLMLAGIGWELFEAAMSMVMHERHKQRPIEDQEKAGGQYDAKWMSASPTDIIFNFAGLVLGMFVNTHLLKPTQITQLAL